MEIITEKKKFYQKNWFAIFMLILFFPIGIFLLWNYSTYSKRKKIFIIGFFAIVFISRLNHQDNNLSTITQQVKESSSQDQLPQVPKLQNLDELQQYLNTLIPNGYTKNDAIVMIEKSTNTPEKYLVSLDLTGNISRDQSVKLGKNFIINAYEAIELNNLPIIYVSFTSQNKNTDDRIYTIGLGSNVYKMLDEKRFTMPPHSFEEWARKHQNQAVDPDGKTRMADRCFVK